MNIRKSAVQLAAGLLTCAAAVPAFADTLSVKAGPIPLQGVPVTVCINNKCESTQPMHSLELGVSISLANNQLVLPAITPSACPAGQIGAAFVVTTLAGGATLGVTIGGKVDTLDYSKTLGPIPLNAQTRTVTVSACST